MLLHSAIMNKWRSLRRIVCTVVPDYVRCVMRAGPLPSFHNSIQVEVIKMHMEVASKYTLDDEEDKVDPYDHLRCKWEMIFGRLTEDDLVPRVCEVVHYMIDDIDYQEAPHSVDTVATPEHDDIYYSD